MAKAKIKKRGCLGAFLWLCLGFTLGVGAAASWAVFINKLYIPFTETPTRDSDISSEESRSNTARETLEFHETLKRQQATPLVEEDDETPQNQEAPRRFVYHLQLGSFSQREDAESLRGELTLSGYRVTISVGKTAGGDDILRVWMGPFENEDDADKMRAQLALNGYSDIPLLKLVAQGE